MMQLIAAGVGGFTSRGLCERRGRVWLATPVGRRGPRSRCLCALWHHFPGEEQRTETIIDVQ